jgi:hypothetical protein
MLGSMLQVTNLIASPRLASRSAGTWSAPNPGRKAFVWKKWRRLASKASVPSGWSIAFAAVGKKLFLCSRVTFFVR